MPARYKVAFIVLNDVYRDSRVLKTADSVADEGHDVRIYAIGGPLSHYPAGVSARASGVEIHRLAVFPDRFRVAAALLRKRADKQVAAHTNRARSSSPKVDAVVPSAPRSIRAQAMDAAVEFALWIRSKDFSKRAARQINAWSPDLVHAHDANTLEAAMKVQRHGQVPFVYDAHELWEERNAKRSARAKRAERRLLDKATARMSGSVTVSPGIQRWMKDRYRLSAEPILVRNIPHAAPVPNPAQGSLRARAALTSEHRVIAYVGGITTGRGIDEVIVALSHLPPDVHLVLLGHGSAQNEAFFRALADRAGVGDRVHFAGSVESTEVSRAAADADVSIVYTQPKNLSYIHSLPNKLFESIRAGLPVVASDLPDVRELVMEYGLGELADPDDVAGLTAAIAAVLESPQEFRRRAVEASALLSWENEMSRLLGLYDQILPTDH